MSVEFIEIEQEATVKGNVTFYSGKISREAMDKLDGKVILRNREAGKIKSQIWMVKGTREDIDAVVASDPSVKHYPTKKLMQLRGLEVRLGTPTLERVNELQQEWKDNIGLDIKTEKNPAISHKPLYQHMKEDLPHIPSRAIRCDECGIMNSGNANICSNCQADLEQNGTLGREPFNVVRWKEP